MKKIKFKWNVKYDRGLNSRVGVKRKIWKWSK